MEKNISTFSLTACSSQRVAAPEKESVSCRSYSSSSASSPFSSYGACDLEHVRRCLDQCCGQGYRPVWAGGDLEEVAGEWTENAQDCRHLLLGEESSCLPPCTTTKVQTMFMYKTEAMKTVRFHTLSLPNRSLPFLIIIN